MERERGETDRLLSSDRFWWGVLGMIAAAHLVVQVLRGWFGF